MKLHRIGGATDIWRGGTNSGIYHLNEEKILVVDPGLSESRGKRFATYALEQGKTISHVVTTHEHSDHIGAFRGIFETFKDCHIIGDYHAAHTIESPDLFLAYINGGAPNESLRGFFRPLEKDVHMEIGLKNSHFTLEDHDFEWLHFGGHSIGSGGLITPDKVLFLGDTLIPSEILVKFRLPLVYGVEKQLMAYDKLKQAEFDHCVTGHGRKVLSKDQCLSLARENQEVLEDCINLIKNLTKAPLTKEVLMSKVVTQLNLQLNYKEYLFGMSSVSSILSYLMDRDEMAYSLEDGLLHFKSTS